MSAHEANATTANPYTEAALGAFAHELRELSRRVAELELRGDNHLRYLDSLQASTDRLAASIPAGELERRRARGDCLLLAAIARAVDPLEAEHDRHTAELLEPRYVVMAIDETPPTRLGAFERTEGKWVLYRDTSGEAARVLADVVAIVPATEAELMRNRRAAS